MRQSLLSLATVSLLSCFLITCSEKPTQPIKLSLDEPFSIELGNSITIDSEHLTVTFLEVNFDLRCSRTVYCWWPGLAEIRLKVSKGAEDPILCDAPIFGDADSVWTARLGLDTLGYKIELVSLVPVPVLIQQDTISGSEVVSATILVSKSQSRLVALAGPSRIIDLPLDSIPPTNAELLSANLVGDTLTIKAKVDKLCVRHYFELSMNPDLQAGSQPPTFSLWLRHTTRTATCSSVPTDLDLKFDMSPLLQYVNQTVGLGIEKALVLREYQALGVPGSAETLIDYLGPPSPGNMPPTFTTIASVKSRFGLAVGFQIKARDRENAPLTLSAFDLPEGAKFVDQHNGQGAFYWLPSAGQEGNHNVTFTVNDGFLADTMVVPIFIRQNRPPRVTGITPVPPIYIVKGKTLYASIYASDQEGDSINFDVYPHFAGAQLTWLPNRVGISLSIPTELLPEMDTTVRIVVSDGIFADTAAMTCSILPYSVDPPQFSVSDTNLIAEEGETTYFTLSATDPNHDSLVYQGHELPPNCAIERIDRYTARLRMSPNYRQHGEYLSVITVSDGALEDEMLLIITIEDRNAPPVLARLQSHVCAVGAAIDFELTAADPDGDVLTFTMSGAPSAARIISLNDSTALFIYQVEAKDIGEYLIAFQVSDNIASDSNEVPLVVVGSAPPVNSIIPMAQGNYWVYGGHRGDSIEVIGSLTESNTVWWYLNKGFNPLTTRNRVSGDSIFSSYGLELIDPHDSAIQFPVHVHAESSFDTDRSASIIPGPITVPAGTFYGCIRFTASNPNLCWNYSFQLWLGTYYEEYIVAPGVGIIKYLHSFRYECTFNTDYAVQFDLVRYRINAPKD